MSKCAEFKFDLICEIIFDKFFPGLTGIRTHGHVHHSVAMRGGCSNHSASGADKVIRVRPAWSAREKICHRSKYMKSAIQRSIINIQPPFTHAQTHSFDLSLT